jgi:xanthine dehydrogenase accessory factor
MFNDFLNKSAELLAQGEAFAVATVVRSLPPTSGKPGDKAIVRADGTLWGWIGGGCAQPVVIKEALKSLAEGHPKLVRISPSPNGSEAGEEAIVDYTMTCHSGGSMDIYIEPVLPRPHIVILGRSAIAHALARLGRAAGYTVSVVAHEVDTDSFRDASLIADLSKVKLTPQTYIVVSTQGEDDEGALEQAVATGASYIAFVASKTKAHRVFDYLRGRGLPEEKLKQIRVPAGLDIGAQSPEEIAISILAEIIQKKATIRAPELNSGAQDPVCGMAVDPAKAKYKSEHRGRWFYFCCAGCKETFERKPEQYTSASPR